MDIQVIGAREVPLGGVRALPVQRTLPDRRRAFVGAWCFADHYGPTDSPMDVAPHPHTGLQTVSWLFAGEIEHRDTAGNVARVRPGEVNLMTAGSGIAHSEVSTGTGQLHGVQLWVALPEQERFRPRSFEHYPVPIEQLPQDGGTARVFIGSLPGVANSPVQVFTPLLGAQLDLAPDRQLQLRLNPGFEHAVILDSGQLTVAGQPLQRSDLAFVDAGPQELTLASGPDGARLILLGGQPFEEEIVMWWNFIGRSHDEIVAFRDEWQAHGARFGTVAGYAGEIDRIPAPPIPGVHLRPRGRLGRH